MLRRTVAPFLYASTLFASIGCDFEEFGIELDDERVVLTPGRSATIRVDIARPEGSGHPVRLALLHVPDGIDATLTETKTTADHVFLTLTSTTDESVEAFALVKAWAGPFFEVESVDVSVQIPTVAAPAEEEFAPGVFGEVKTLDMNGQDVTYEVVNGKAILDGDIVLGDASAIETEFRSGTCNFNFNTEFHCSRWTNGIIGYNFADDWGDDEENARMRGIIESAMNEWEANTGIRFVERYSGEFLQFRDGDGCSSTVGRAVITGFDSQSISLANDGCDSFGVALHEIGHAIGLWHEQSRNDRDDFITVDFGRVRDGKLHQFFKFLDYGRDIGPYDYGSIMHYPTSHFARNKAACRGGDLSECTIRPHDEDAEIGQRDGLSELDILGAYVLYPPEFTIVGAEPDETGDHFFLLLDFDTPLPDPFQILWKGQSIASPLGSGYNLEVGTGNLGHGPTVVTAEFRVAGFVVASASIALNMVNDAPVVSLATTDGETERDLGVPFGVSATVNDTEDGACPSPTCAYNWTPTPTSTAGGNVAFFTFDEPGPQTVDVEVVDAGGEVGTASLAVDVVNTAPTATILQPNGDLTVAVGTDVELEGIAYDINDPSGALPCSALTWSSASPGDVFHPSATGCSPILELVGGGVRTISLVATDPQGEVSNVDSVQIAAAACDGNCAPTAFFSLSDPDDGDAYFIDFPTTVFFTIGDAEASSVDIELVARRAGDPDAVIVEGGVSLFSGPLLVFDDSYVLAPGVIPLWPGCENPSGRRAYDFVLTVDDGEETTTHTESVQLGCSFN